jgi:UDP-glucose 4-epimerase
MQIQNGRFLVIGGAGLIGSHLVDQLLAGGARQVRVYDNFSRGTMENLKGALEDARCEIFSDGGDIQHKDILLKAMEGMDGVFHLAALWLLQCYEYPRSAFDVNIAGTMNVIEAVIATGVKRLVFSSSASVYGDAVSEPMKEDHPFLCQEFYGASKVSGEMILRAMYNRQKNRDSGFDYVSLRYMNVYGPRQDDKGAYVGVITRMLNAIDAGQAPIIHDDGTQAYDFVDVRDCARANILAMQAQTTNRTYNVGTGIKTSITKLSSMLSTLYPQHLSATYQPTERPFVKNRVGSTKLAQQDLGFTAEIKLEAGLKDLIHWRACQ